jgi:hypothetical protein
LEDVAMKPEHKPELRFDELLHPAQAFNHPSEVVNDPDLTLNEKRAILASWASDACAVEAAPALRQGREWPVPFDDIMEALRMLDRQADGAVRYRHPFGARFRRSRPGGEGDHRRSLQ